MCLPLTTGTTLTVSSVFITGTVVDSRSFSSVILETISASISISWFPSNIDVTHVLLEEPRSPFSRSMRFCKTKKLINAVPSQDRNQGPIRTIFFSIKMMTQSYRFTSLQVSKNPTPPPSKPQCTRNCHSIKHLLTCLLQNLKRHYHIQRSLPHFPITGQRNPVHISHRI